MEKAYDIKDISQAKRGKLRIEWASKEMPVLNLIKRRFEKEKPLAGRKLACCLHVTSETANLMAALKAGGAKIALCASNPLSTQDDVAASLAADLKIPVFAKNGEDEKTYYSHIDAVLKISPDITVDDGADLVTAIHKKQTRIAAPYKSLRDSTGHADVKGRMTADSPNLPIGGMEETTTGVIRLRALERAGKLRYPLIAVNDAQTKFMFDNRYGTGQSTIDGIIRATNLLLAGKNFVVCGYGWCGKGVAMRAKGLGANVIVTETNPTRALEAAMDGFRVMPIKDAAKIGNIFVTLTGDINVITKESFSAMNDGAVVCNSGHFNVELDLDGLRQLSRKVRRVRDFIDEYQLSSGKRIYLLGEGRLVNLVAAEGHPASVMDMSFANQALCAEYIAKNSKELKARVYKVPQHIDEEIARLKLQSMGIKIDQLTKEQKKYLESWELGT